MMQSNLQRYAAPTSRSISKRSVILAQVLWVLLLELATSYLSFPVELVLFWISIQATDLLYHNTSASRIAQTGN
jgi:hypothetical protein